MPIGTIRYHYTKPIVLGSGSDIVIVFNPAGPVEIPNWTPLGAIVLTVTITSGGSPYLGTPILTDPDDIYLLVDGPSTGVFYIIVDPNGPGVGPEGGNTDSLSVEAL